MIKEVHDEHVWLFSHSPKWHFEFLKFAYILDTKGNKIIKDVKTTWMSMLEPFKTILEKYHLLFVVMQVDSNLIQVGVSSIYTKPSL